MRKLFWQRWALIFLLVTRLVIGELGHATPAAASDDMGASHQHHQMTAELSSADQAACAAHEGSDQQMPVASHGCDSAADTSSGEQECCKSGECECPCLHVPCAALDAHVLNPIATTVLRIPQGAEGFVSQRPSRLFRPPARFS